MKSFKRGWFKDGSLISDFSESLNGAVTRNRTTIALNAAKVEAELASKAKSEFIANMSHELRTPLNAIIGFSEMLHSMGVDDKEKVHQYSAYIKQAADHLLALINGILDISKIQAGKLAIEPIETDLGAVIESCMLIIDAKALEKNIRTTTDIAGDLPIIVADPLRLKQVLINLLFNAVKFTDNGGSVEMTAQRWGESEILMTIKDNGIGMTSQEIDRAMMPFEQIESGLSRNNDGTGLGLPLAVALIKMHGGNIQIESSKSVGTTVGIVLPQQCSSEHCGGNIGVLETGQPGIQENIDYASQ